MRAIAALSIIAFHAGTRAPTSAPAPEYTMRLNTGVWLFFLLSAFLLYRPFVRSRFRREDMPSVTRYGWHRLLRIVPAYWVALVVVALVFSERDVFDRHGVAYFAFGQIYSAKMFLGGLPVAWSLCIEMTLYAFLPLWALSLRRRGRGPTAGRAILRRELLGVTVLLALSVVFKAFYLTKPHATGAGFAFAQSMPRYLDAFAVGMGLAILSAWYEGRRLPRVLRVIDRLPSISWLLAGVTFWAFSTQIGLPILGGTSLSHAQVIERDLLRTLFAAFLLLPCIFGNQDRGGVRWFLRRRTLLYVGSVSYGVYLWHLITQNYLMKWNVVHTVASTLHVSDWLALVVLNSVAAIAIASLSFRFIERPALALKNAPWKVRRGDVPPTFRARTLSAVWGITLVLIGVVGVGYQFLNTVLIGSGAVLVALAVGVGRYGVPRLSVAMRAAAAVTAVAAVVPLVLAPINHSTPVAEAASTPTATTASASGSGPKLAPRVYLVATYDGSKLRLYVNGALASARPLTGPVDRGGAVTELGGSAPAPGWSGILDEVALYQRALSPAAIAEHYQIGIGHTTGHQTRNAGGTKAGGKKRHGQRHQARPSQSPTYAQAVTGTPGVVGYWRLDGRGRPVHDSVGKSTGRSTQTGVLHGFYGLITHDPDKSVVLDGIHGEIMLSRVPAVPKAFSIEAWAVAGRAISNRTVAGRPGSWFLKTDVLGRWTAGLVQNGKPVSTTARQTAQRSLPPTPTGSATNTTSTTTTRNAPTSNSGGGSSLALLALLAAVGLTVAALPAWRRRRSDSDEADEDGPEEPTPPDGTDATSEPEAATDEERRPDGAPV